MKKFIIGFVSLTMVVTFVLPANAQTVADLTTQINNLLTTIAQLQAQLNALQSSSTVASSPVATSPCVFNRDLTIGSTGADVTALQQFLVSKGYLIMPAATSYGYFGSLTESALAQFQADNGISPAVGYFGPQTRAVVCTPLNTTTITNVSQPSPVSGTSGAASVDLKANGVDGPVTVPYGTSVKFTWDSKYANACTASVSPSDSTSSAWNSSSKGSVNTTVGQAFSNLTANKTFIFTLTCTNTVNSAKDEVKVTISYPTPTDPAQALTDLKAKTQELKTLAYSSYLANDALDRIAYIRTLLNYLKGKANSKVSDTLAVLDIAEDYVGTPYLFRQYTDQLLSTVNLISLTVTASVDIKANSSDGPITLSSSQSFTVSWISKEVSSCYTSINGVYSSGVIPIGDFYVYSGHSFYPPTGGQKEFTITCEKNTGGTVTDSVVVKAYTVTTTATSTTPTPPATPTGLTPTPDSCGTGKIKLSWNASTGATSYELYRNGSQINFGQTGATSYTDSNLTAGNYYGYSVRATSLAGSSAMSSVVYGSALGACTTPTVTPTPPATPTGLTPTPDSCGTGKIKLSWNASTGATSYELYRNGSQINFGQTGATSYTDSNLTAGNYYGYSVRATSLAGSSAMSSVVYGSALGACVAPPSPIVDLKANGISNSTSLSFGQSATLTWSSQNADSCTAYEQPFYTYWKGLKTVGSGSETLNNLPANTNFTFTLICTNSTTGASANDSVAVSVGANTGLTNKSPEQLVVSGSMEPQETLQNAQYDYFVSAIDPENSNITYTIDWGDGSGIDSRTVASGAQARFIKYWYSAGRYNAVLTAKDTSGAMAQKSFWVTVSPSNLPSVASIWAAIMEIQKTLEYLKSQLP